MLDVATKPMSVSPKDITFKTLKIRECNQEDDKFKSLVISIQQYGQLQRVLCRPDVDEDGKVIPGKYEGIDGNNRLPACIAAGLKTINIEVGDFSDDQVMLLQSNLNFARVHQKDAEVAAQIRNFASVHPGMKQREMARAFGMSEVKFGQLLGITKKLVPEALKAFTDGAISTSNAITLKKCAEEVQPKLIEAAKTTGTVDFNRLCRDEQTTWKKEKTGVDEGPVPRLQKKAEIEDRFELYRDKFEAAPNDKLAAILYHEYQWLFSMDEATLAAKKETKDAKTAKASLDQTQREIIKKKKLLADLEAQLAKQTA